MAIRRTAVITAALSMLGGIPALSTAVAPFAAASTNCGSYVADPANPGPWNLLITSGDASCAQARSVLADWSGGKATMTSRNGGNVDGYACVGNPGGVLDETGVLEYCDAGSTHVEVHRA
jgi:hypothetical protein